MERNSAPDWDDADQVRRTEAGVGFEPLAQRVRGGIGQSCVALRKQPVLEYDEWLGTAAGSGLGG